ncbi:Uncharacterised protein [uncultured archaeon]|nr:Uncharacterised protein [uncultured archaeon]
MNSHEDAASEVIGMILILSVMMIVIGSIMLVGVPMIESGRNDAKMDVAMNSFMSLQNDIEEVVRGPIWVKNPNEITDTKGLGPSRETEFELMGGALSVIPNSTNVTYSRTNRSNFTIIIPPSNITYIAGQEIIAYENGAVIRKYEGGYPLMVSEPLISIYDTKDRNVTVSIHAVCINGTLSSTGGDGKAWVETRLKHYNQTIEPDVVGKANNTYINLTTDYPDAWKVFFEGKLKDAGLVPSIRGNATGYNISGTRPLEVQIYGNGSTSRPDIFLSVYESRIDVKVR